MRDLLLTALTLVVFLGCSSQLGLGRARTLDAGHVRLGGGLEADFLIPHTGEKTSVPLPWIQATAGVHVGATDRVELGARLWGFVVPKAVSTFGIAIDGKVGILRPKPEEGRWHLSTGLSLAYHRPRYGGQPYHIFGVTVPLLVGVSIGQQERRHELVFGPRVVDYVWTGYGQNTVNAFYLGGSLGFAGVVKRSFELFPEIVLMGASTSFNGETTDKRQGVSLVQIGLSGSFEP